MVINKKKFIKHLFLLYDTIIEQRQPQTDLHINMGDYLPVFKEIRFLIYHNTANAKKDLM